jgi:hypothetical protein
VGTTRVSTKSIVRLLLLLALLIAEVQGAARAETYRGLLIPESRNPPIPVTVDLEHSRGRLSGQVTTSSPMSGTGRIVSGERQRSVCNFKSDIGAGRKFAFEGYCLSTVIEGTYTVTLPDGSSRRGTYRLAREEPQNTLAKKPAEASAEPGRVNTACLSANSACLAACPREDYNAAFICSNRCRQKLAACKARAGSIVASPGGPASQPER